jgi:hypothetical protein
MIERPEPTPRPIVRLGSVRAPTCRNATKSLTLR